jgi:hypothetical protein
MRKPMMNYYITWWGWPLSYLTMAAARSRQTLYYFSGCLPPKGKIRQSKAERGSPI